MELKFSKAELPGVILVEPEIHSDERGCFLELYHRQKYRSGGIEADFSQDNFSRSTKGVLRGLHYQLQNPQAKLVTVLNGEIFDVVVDIRRRSATFGKWLGVCLSGENKRQLLVPEGFAHGFCVLSETADVLYKCSRFYDPGDDRGILWSDPDLGIEWPLANPRVSPKDARHPRLKDTLAAEA